MLRVIACVNKGFACVVTYNFLHVMFKQGLRVQRKTRINNARVNRAPLRVSVNSFSGFTQKGGFIPGKATPGIEGYALRQARAVPFNLPKYRYRG